MWFPERLRSGLHQQSLRGSLVTKKIIPELPLRPNGRPGTSVTNTRALSSVPPEDQCIAGSTRRKLAGRTLATRAAFLTKAIQSANARQKAANNGNSRTPAW